MNTETIPARDLLPGDVLLLDGHPFAVEKCQPTPSGHMRAVLADGGFDRTVHFIAGDVDVEVAS